MDKLCVNIRMKLTQEINIFCARKLIKKNHISSFLLTQWYLEDICGSTQSDTHPEDEKFMVIRKI